MSARYRLALSGSMNQSK